MAHIPEHEVEREIERLFDAWEREHVESAAYDEAFTIAAGPGFGDSSPFDLSDLKRDVLRAVRDWIDETNRRTT